jgi:hypothetical protein
MNLKLLAEANDASDALTRAAARKLVAVQAQIQDRAHGRVLVLPPEAGYGAVEEAMTNLG